MAAIERAIRAERSDPTAVGSAERELSAALLCIKSSRSANYGNVTIRDIHYDTVERLEREAKEREAALRAFLALVGHRYTLPAGSGCKEHAF